MRTLREERLPGPFPVYALPEWSERFPWLVHGTTGRGDDADPFDLGLFGETPVGVATRRWLHLRNAFGMPAAVHARQVHGARIRVHTATGPGLHIGEGDDGHATTEPGLLLAVSVADCVPVSLVDPEHRAIAVLHAGWRGVAAGILEQGLATLARLSGVRPGDIIVHLGPAICGACYEVGPEVHRALGLEPPARPAPVDLRELLARQARAAGVPDDQISVSEHCTRCAGSPFFSHRGGDSGRQMGLLGLRPA